MTGDIFGTMMGYLNNVEAGGATAFCKPFKEEIIQPRKGSITFWYSLGNEIHLFIKNQLWKASAQRIDLKSENDSWGIFHRIMKQ